MTTELRPRRLPLKLDRELVALYRAWDSLERARFANSVIDFDLAPQDAFPAFKSREEVLQALETQQRNLQSLEDTAADEDAEAEARRRAATSLLHSRLRASATLLRAWLGETFEFDPFIRSTLGIEPREFGEEEIERKRNEVNALLQREFNISFRRQDFKEFEADFKLQDSSAFDEHFRLLRARWLPILLSRLDFPEEEFRRYTIDFSLTKEDAYWKNWISGNLSQHRIQLRVNVHPRHHWYKGSSELLTIHEYCGHAVQMVNWHRRIEAAKMPRVFGILTVHFPDQFLLEGLAEALPYLLPTPDHNLETQTQVFRELQYYTLMVFNNLHLLANGHALQAARDAAFRTNVGPEAALHYALERLPFTDAQLIEKEIRDRTQNPLFRCYQYVYGTAKRSFLDAFAGLTSEDSNQLLRWVYDGPMTPQQFEAAAQDLKKKNGAPLLSQA